MDSRLTFSSRFAFERAETMRVQYGITQTDLAHIQAFESIIAPHMERVVNTWYDWLRTQPEYDQYFSEGHTLERVQGLQHAYWDLFMSGAVDDAYVERRRKVGEAHARIGLPLSTYFAGMNNFLERFAEIALESELSDSDRLAIQTAIAKLLHLDTAIVVDTYNALVEDTLTAQSNSMSAMSTPVTAIWDNILLLPLVGMIDSRRARDVMNSVLGKIAESQARIFILDISGVGMVDTAVANHLIKISRATRLMGCECIISGLSAAIAQSIVDLGIEVDTVKTTATMKDALAYSFGKLGLEMRALV